MRSLSAAYFLVTPGFFAAIRAPLVAGRDFATGDISSPPASVRPLSPPFEITQDPIRCTSTTKLEEKAAGVCHLAAGHLAAGQVRQI